MSNNYDPITGLYPGTHNIIADQFIDNEEKNYFDKTNEQSTGQLKWYGIKINYYLQVGNTNIV